MSEPNRPTRLSPWLANELRTALDERDVATIFTLIGDYLELQDLRMPAAALADWRKRGLVEGHERAAPRAG